MGDVNWRCVLLALCEYLDEFLPIVQFNEDFREFDFDDHHHCRAYGPAVEVLYPDGYVMVGVSFNVGAVIVVVDNSIWVERNTCSGREHGNFYFDPCDPGSFEAILAVLRVPDAMRSEFSNAFDGKPV